MKQNISSVLITETYNFRFLSRSFSAFIFLKISKCDRFLKILSIKKEPNISNLF